MVIFLQFPLTDIRLFVETNTTQLPMPQWPSPTPYREFVRSFGSIRVRTRGGIPGWLGENEICDARHAMVLSKFTSFIDQPSCDKINIKCSARHFYFDGLATGRYEIVFVTSPSSLHLSSRSLRDFICHILNISVAIPVAYNERINTKLIYAAKYLAQLYLFSSSYTHSHQVVKCNEWIIHSDPVMFVECSTQDKINIPSSCQAVQIADNLGVQLNHWWLKDQNWAMRIWLLKRASQHKLNTQIARTLRLYIMRLHAEYASMKAVMKCIDRGQITLSNDTIASSKLQHYLNVATRRISQIKHRAQKNYGIDELDDLARASLESISPGQLDGVLQKLEFAQIRPQIYSKVERLGTQIFIKEQTVGDKYDISGQVGAVGPQSHAHDMTFTQIGSQIEKSIDLTQLANELSKLRQAMKKESVEAEQDIAVSEVAKAEQAAKEKEASKVAEHLKSAGMWALDIAIKIGVPLAIEALKQATGIK